MRKVYFSIFLSIFGIIYASLWGMDTDGYGKKKKINVAPQYTHWSLPARQTIANAAQIITPFLLPMAVSGQMNNTDTETLGPVIGVITIGAVVIAVFGGACTYFVCKSLDTKKQEAYGPEEGDNRNDVQLMQLSVQTNDNDRLVPAIPSIYITPPPYHTSDIDLGGCRGVHTGQ